MSIYQRGETYVHRVVIKDKDNNKLDPATIIQGISDPCGTAVLSSASMLKDADGEYYYNYAISSTATYGKYPVTVTATTSGGNVTIIKNEYFVLSWDASKDVRQITGIGDTKTISDTDLENLVWLSYQEALRDVYSHNYGDKPKGNPDTGTGFDGTNTVFQTRLYPIADINGDGQIRGHGELSCGTDISGWWIDDTGSYNECWIVVSKYKNGEITITQSDGVSAIPVTNEGVYLDYWNSYSSFNTTLFTQAVNYLTAHNVMLRLKEIDRVTIADVSSNAPVIVKDDYRFYNKYRDIIKKVCRPRIGSI